MPKKKSQPVQLPEVKHTGYNSGNVTWASQTSTAFPHSTSLHGQSGSRFEADFSSEFLTGSTVDWEIQSPEDIIQEVKSCVQARKPWRQEVDEEQLESHRHASKHDRSDGGFHIILPDNRVRAVEDHINRRLRAQLLGEEVSEALLESALPRAPNKQPPWNRRPQLQGQTPRRVRNPWYLPSTIWFTEQVGVDPFAVGSGGFPYDTRILGKAAAPKQASASQKQASYKDEDSRPYDENNPRPLTQKEKESLQSAEFRKWMKVQYEGSRLPHCLQ